MGAVPSVGGFLRDPSSHLLAETVDVSFYIQLNMTFFTGEPVEPLHQHFQWNDSYMYRDWKHYFCTNPVYIHVLRFLYFDNMYHIV